MMKVMPLFIYFCFLRFLHIQLFSRVIHRTWIDVMFVYLCFTVFIALSSFFYLRITHIILCPIIISSLGIKSHRYMTEILPNWIQRKTRYNQSGIKSYNKTSEPLNFKKFQTKSYHKLSRISDQFIQLTSEFRADKAKTCVDFESNQKYIF